MVDRSKSEELLSGYGAVPEITTPSKIVKLEKRNPIHTLVYPTFRDLLEGIYFFEKKGYKGEKIKDFDQVMKSTEFKSKFSLKKPKFKLGSLVNDLLISSIENPTEKEMWREVNRMFSNSSLDGIIFSENSKETIENIASLNFLLHHQEHVYLNPSLNLGGFGIGLGNSLDISRTPYGKYTLKISIFDGEYEDKENTERVLAKSTNAYIKDVYRPMSFHTEPVDDLWHSIDLQELFNGIFTPKYIDLILEFDSSRLLSAEPGEGIGYERYSIVRDSEEDEWRAEEEDDLRNLDLHRRHVSKTYSSPALPAFRHRVFDSKLGNVSNSIYAKITPPDFGYISDEFMERRGNSIVGSIKGPSHHIMSFREDLSSGNFNANLDGLEYNLFNETYDNVYEKLSSNIERINNSK